MENKNNPVYLMLHNPIPKHFKSFKKEILDSFNEPEGDHDLEDWINEGVIYGVDLESIIDRIFSQERKIRIHMFRWRNVLHMFSLSQYKRYLSHIKYTHL